MIAEPNPAATSSLSSPAVSQEPDSESPARQLSPSDSESYQVHNMKRPGGGIASLSEDSVTAEAEARAALARRTAPRQQLPGPQNFHYYYDGDASASEEHSLVPSQVQITVAVKSLHCDWHTGSLSIPPQSESLTAHGDGLGLGLGNSSCLWQ